MTIAIMSAMNQELESLVDELQDATRAVTGEREGERVYHAGTLWDNEAILVFSRWGKVAAATTATFLISKFGVDEIIFTGVAGAASDDVRIGDVVIATKLYQHDMDAEPLFHRHTIPLLGRSFFETDALRRSELVHAAETFLARKTLDHQLLSEFDIEQPKVALAGVASGDKFFADRQEIKELKKRLPDVGCVEMEGAAVAQVCFEYGVPCSVVRTISDSADHSAGVDFPRFTGEVAAKYSHGIIRELLGS